MTICQIRHRSPSHGIRFVDGDGRLVHTIDEDSIYPIVLNDFFFLEEEDTSVEGPSREDRQRCKALESFSVRLCLLCSVVGGARRPLEPSSEVDSS